MMFARFDQNFSSLRCIFPFACIMYRVACPSSIYFSQQSECGAFGETETVVGTYIIIYCIRQVVDGILQICFYKFVYICRISLCEGRWMLTGLSRIGNQCYISEPAY